MMRLGSLNFENHDIFDQFNIWSYKKQIFTVEILENKNHQKAVSKITYNLTAQR